MHRWRATWLGLLAVYLIGLASASLSRVMYQDAPIMLYGAFVVDRLQLVPYRDFFDNQMPGVYAANVAIGRLSQYSEIGVRWVDLGALALLLGITVGILHRLGRGAAWCAALYVGILYLASEEYLSLQREFLFLLPLSAAAWVAIALAFTPRHQSAYRRRPSWSRRDDQTAGSAVVRSSRGVDCLHARHDSRCRSSSWSSGCGAMLR